MNAPFATVSSTSLQRIAISLLTILVATALAYSTSFDGPFIFDDYNAVPQNPHVRSLWPLGDAMMAPERSSVAGRPLVSLTLAVNYAISGERVWSYHAGNLLIHLLNATLLFLLLWRTLQSERVNGFLREHALFYTWGVTLIWALHPLNSETVIYIVQRTELMVSTFLMFSFLALIHAAKPSSSVLWQVVVVLCVVFALLCKELAAVAPLLLLFYDRAFLTGSFREAFKRRGVMYLGLAATWLLAGWLAMGSHRGGLGEGDPSLYWRYPLTQGAVILWYFRLVFFPYPLAITYHWPMVDGVLDSLPESAVILGLLLGTFYALWRHPKLGFLGACFFFILAPTSSFIPIMTEVVGERRMYLPSIVIITLAVILATLLLRWARGRWTQVVAVQPMLLSAAVVLAFAAGATTYVRSHDFDTDLSIWEQTVRVQPENSMAMSNLAAGYIFAERLTEAELILTQVERVAPKQIKLPMNWGLLRFHQDKYLEAAKYFEQAAEREPDLADNFSYAGACYAELRQYEKAQTNFAKALEIDPTHRMTLNLIALTLQKQGNTDAAFAAMQEVVREHDDFGTAQGNLAVMLDKRGRTDEARLYFQRAYRLAPESMEVLYNFGTFEARHKNWSEAERYLTEAMQYNPSRKEIYLALAEVYRQTNRFQKAEEIFRPLLRASPADAELHNQYGVLLVTIGRYKEAEGHFATAVHYDPNSEDAQRNLALTRVGLKQIEEGNAAGDVPPEQIEGLKDIKNHQNHDAVEGAGMVGEGG